MSGLWSLWEQDLGFCDLALCGSLFSVCLPAEKGHSGPFSAIKVSYGAGSDPWRWSSIVGGEFVSPFGCTPVPFLLIKFLRIKTWHFFICLFDFCICLAVLNQMERRSIYWIPWVLNIWAFEAESPGAFLWYHCGRDMYTKSGSVKGGGDWSLGRKGPEGRMTVPMYDYMCMWCNIVGINNLWEQWRGPKPSCLPPPLLCFPWEWAD